MNLLESFSLTTGIKAGNSYIYKKLYPLPFQNYIVLNSQNEDQNLNYAFWSRVVQLIEPILSKQNIKIIHFIDDKPLVFNHIYVDKNISLSEKAYLLSHSRLFCGPSKLYSLISSEFKIPQVYLKWDYSIDNILATKDEIINTNSISKNFINPIGNFINNIRPEEISEKILKKLFPDQNFSFDKTLSIGKVYSISAIDLIPDCSFKITNDSKNEIIVRMDEFFSEENLSDQLKNGPASIVTNKKISERLLSNYRNSIKKMYFKVEKDSDPSFLDVLENLKIKYDIITSLSAKELEPEKIKYLNYKIINKLNLTDLSFLDGLDKSKIYFKTNRIVIKSGKTFASRWHLKNNIPSKDIRNETFSLPTIINDTFKEESDSFYFLTTEQI